MAPKPIHRFDDDNSLPRLQPPSGFCDLRLLICLSLHQMLPSHRGFGCFRVGHESALFL